MIHELSAVQTNKIRAGAKMIEYNTDPDCLYRLVVVVGVCTFGAIISSNSDTVWSRIENPYFFRYEEIKKLSEAFETPVTRFWELIELQAQHNKDEQDNNSPIGRAKYNPHKYPK